MATIKEMIREHNEVARAMGVAELAHWKQAGEKLRERIEAMRSAHAPAAADPLDLPAAAEALGDGPADLATPSAAEEPGGADQAPVEAAEPVVESAEAPTRSGKGIGKLVESLLLDAEGFDYPTIVEMVTGEFPDAQTSTRSVASVAAALRRKGVEVPMRRTPRSAKA